MAKKAKKAAKKAAKKPAKKAAKAVKKTAKKVVKKVVKKAPAKAAKKPAKKVARKPNAAFMVALTPSAALAEVVGSKPLPRTEAIKKIWDYIKKNNLQDSKNRRMINADAKLKVLFGGKGQVSMFELAGIVNNHVKK
ncbi:MAG: SWIB/MDM2 domain-containing protein [Cyclobacteriaceae bacterium]|nr:SWIB/MDM2 domain-containing protein [Cyclobacteriaceae bacterium]MDH4297531.1 SWIB/MDM2 domain-containing protein [Cyclobacteriaceae bacterium]MDH5250883.1 SWIB/MDM2 domain-containing protein [Cyclobacteriaceae bacterium]